MNIAEQWRQEIKALLPCGFLRISREAGFLFVSDFPARVQETERILQALENAGFHVTLRGRMAFLDGTEEKYRKVSETEIPGVSLRETDANSRLLYAARLLMEKGKDENFALCREVMRLTALKDDKGLEKLPEQLALFLRKNEPLSFLAGKILLQYISQREEKTC